MARVYEYDVFISYKRAGANVPAWIRNHFHPRLSEWLHDNIERDVKVFFDDQSVSVGASWPREVRLALQRTRILLPVCSPPYFMDEWCLAEWHSMALREEMVGAHTLIYPVIFCDSANFPDYAKARRMRNFRNWNQPSPQFETSLGYIDFHRLMNVIAEDLVKLIEDAPPWQPDWPVTTPAPGPPTPSTLPRF